MNSTEVLLDAFGRVHDVVHRAVDGFPAEQLDARLDSDANSIAWLVWHLTRIQDDQVAAAAGLEQVWLGRGWADRFGLPFDRTATGYGHGTEHVAAVKVRSGELLTGYYDETHEQTIRYVAGLGDTDLDRIVDTAWDPPVTLGVRLVSVIQDCLEHGGQAAFIRGVLDRR